jgi:hypothetical protein
MNNKTFQQHQTAPTVFPALASQSCDIVNTRTCGSNSVTCYATDNAGNSTNQSVNYTVQSGFNFTGFFAPVDHLPTINVGNDGQATPLKFGFGGYQGLNTSLLGIRDRPRLFAMRMHPATTSKKPSILEAAV